LRSFREVKKQMSFDSDFEEIFGDWGIFNSKSMKRIQREMDEIFKDIKNGKIRGTWETREIKEPGVNGFIIMGRFGSDEALEPFEPLKPQRRRPMPERPFELPRTALEETREPLTDIFEQENTTKIYVELPGEEEGDISLEAKPDGIEVKAKNFYKMIELPNRHIAKETIISKCKNGVLEITIPKKKEIRPKDTEKERLV
jgi:HSP20 family protein